MADLILTTGDTAPTLTMTCASGGAAAVLTGAAVVIHVLRPDATTISRAGTIVNDVAGTVSMEWQAGDLTLAGRYYVEAQVTFSNGKIQTFGRPSFVVQEQIA